MNKTSRVQDFVLLLYRFRNKKEEEFGGGNWKYVGFCIGAKIKELGQAKGKVLALGYFGSSEDPDEIAWRVPLPGNGSLLAHKGGCALPGQSRLETVQLTITNTKL